MDRAAIRAKAEELAGLPSSRPMLSWQDEVAIAIEAALTTVHNEAWNKRGEADAKACAEVGRNSTKQVRKFIQAFPVSSEHIGKFFTDAVKAIRRLRIEDK